MNDLVNRIDHIVPDLVAWRRDLHAHPEMGFQEHRTAAFVAAQLASFGLEVHTGIGGTGVVGVLRGAEGPLIGLRADMDALPIVEATGLSYESKHPGTMHACGHDGHTTMLLGAARIMADGAPRKGSVVFIFQPAEEFDGGARVMVEDGLFARFPVSAVYGMHNCPGLALGQIAVRPGPMMAAFDTFELVITGKGSHAAMPEQGIDPIMISGQLQAAWQAIISRSVCPTDAAVISVTQIHAGESWNVIPDKIVLRGTVRSLLPRVRDFLESMMAERAALLCGAFGAESRFDYTRRYPATINSFPEAEAARRAAIEVVGEAAVQVGLAPSMGAEDFAFLLEQKPGAYVWIGNGPAEGGRNLHSPLYDFNDEAIPTGVAYWVTLADREIGGDRAV